MKFVTIIASLLFFLLMGVVTAARRTPLKGQKRPGGLRRNLLFKVKVDTTKAMPEKDKTISGDSAPAPAKKDDKKDCKKRPKDDPVRLLQDASEPVPPPTSPPDEQPDGEFQVDGKPAKKDDKSVIGADGVDPEADLPWCPEPNVHKKKRSAEECQQLRDGVLPTSDRRIAGSLELDMKYQEINGNPIAKVSELLNKKTGPEAAGCPATVRRKLQEPASQISISGVEFSGLQKVDDECSDGATENCDSVKTNVNIYYEGDRDATEEEADQMMQQVTDTMQKNSVQSTFGLTRLDNIDPTIDTIETQEGGGPNIGVIAGGSLAAAALVGGAVAYKKGYGKRMLPAKWR